MLNLHTNPGVVIPQKPKSAFLPLLTVLFVISYGLMVMLIVEQGRTIDTQRYLIRSLFTDSKQLTAMKGNAQRKAQAQAQAGRADRTRNSTGKARALPQKPPKDASDSSDERRSLLAI